MSGASTPALGPPLRSAPAPEPPRVSLTVAGAALGIGAVSTVVFWTVIVPHDVFASVAVWSDGIVTPTAILTSIHLAAMLAVMRCAQIRRSAMGFDLTAGLRALAPTLAVWALVIAMLRLGAMTLGTTAMPAPTAGEILTQVLTSAPTEEVAFRGLLLVALAQHLYRRGVTPRRAIALALLGSTLVFVVFHIPRTIAYEIPLDHALFMAARQAEAGVAFGLAYVLTGNLWFSALVHALGNLSLTPWPVPIPIVEDAWAVSIVAVALVWRRVGERRQLAGLPVLADHVAEMSQHCRASPSVTFPTGGLPLSNNRAAWRTTTFARAACRSLPLCERSSRATEDR